MFRLLLVFSVFIVTSNAYCESFISACSATPGYVINGGSPITLSSRGSYYLYYTNVESAVRAISSVFYGKVDVYVTYVSLREPKVTDHDLASSDMGTMPDFLKIVRTIPIIIK